MKEFMRNRVATVSMDDRLDVIEAIVELNRDTETLNRQAQIINRHPVAISPGQTQQAAARPMLARYLFSCLPVLENGALVGIFGWRDRLQTLPEGDSA